MLFHTRYKISKSNENKDASVAKQCVDYWLLLNVSIIDQVYKVGDFVCVS